MSYTKTQQAIMALFDEHPQSLCADEIFMQLNPGEKHHSYAAVYNNISILCEQGILKAEKSTRQRSKLIKLAI